MDELVRWLGEQLDEDERIAKAATPGPWEQTGIGDFGWTVSGAWVETPDSEQGRADADFIAAHDPARVLREIEAKRQLIAEHDVYGRGPGERMDCQSLDFPCRTLRLLALPYAARPGYAEALAAAG